MVNSQMENILEYAATGAMKPNQTGGVKHANGVVITRHVAANSERLSGRIRKKVKEIMVFYGRSEEDAYALMAEMEAAKADAELANQLDTMDLAGRRETAEAELANQLEAIALAGYKRKTSKKSRKRRSSRKKHRNRRMRRTRRH